MREGAPASQGHHLYLRRWLHSTRLPGRGQGAHELIRNLVIEETQAQTITDGVSARPHSFAGFPSRIQSETRVLKALAELRKASIHLTGPGRQSVDGHLKGQGVRGKGTEPEKENGAGTAKGRGTDLRTDRARYRDLHPSMASWLTCRRTRVNLKPLSARGAPSGLP